MLVHGYRKDGAYWLFDPRGIKLKVKLIKRERKWSSFREEEEVPFNHTFFMMCTSFFLVPRVGHTDLEVAARAVCVVQRSILEQEANQL